MKIKSFEDLEVWETAKELVVRVYQLVKSFPKDEIFGITSQIKRAALSPTGKHCGGLWKISLS